MLTHILSRKKYKLIFKLSCLAGILILALALRLYHLDSFSFRYDEASQVLDNRSILHLPALYKFFNAGYTVKNHDYLNLYNHSIVYYWRKVFGESERNLRFSSVIFSLLSIIAVFRLAQKYFSEKSAYIAAILISLSAFHIYYAQELRPYAATGLFSLLAVYCFLGYLNNRKNSYIYLYAILSIINIYSLFVTITLTCALALYPLINFKKYRNFLPKLALVNLLILIMTIPASVIIINRIRSFLASNTGNFQIVEYPVWLQKVTLKHLINTLKNMSIGYNVAYEASAGRIITILSCGFFGYGVFKYRKNEAARILGICFLFPVLLIFALSQFKVCYVDRYFFPQSILYILGISLGLSRLKRVALIIIMGGIIYINIIALNSYYNNIYPDPSGINHRFGVDEKLDIRPLAEYIYRNYSTGDGIIHSWKGNVFPLKYYVSRLTRDKSLLSESDRGTVVDYNQENGKFSRLEYSDLHPFVSRIEGFDILNAANAPRGIWVIEFAGDTRIAGYLKSRGYAQKVCKIFNRNTLYYLKYY